MLRCVYIVVKILFKFLSDCLGCAEKEDIRYYIAYTYSLCIYYSDGKSRINKCSGF